MKFATKPIVHYPPHLGHVAKLLWKINNLNVLQTQYIFEHKLVSILVW